jgi:hypothetical protein
MRNNSEECTSHLLRGRSLESHIIFPIPKPDSEIRRSLWYSLHVLTSSHLLIYNIFWTELPSSRGLIAKKAWRNDSVLFVRRGPGSVVGIATDYALGGPGIESRWGRDFLHLSRPALGPTQPPVQWVPCLSRGVKSSRGVTLIPYLLLVPWSWKSRAIPLLPLWTVRPVQSLSACTRVTFTYL